MKKFISILMAAALCLSLAACGGEPTIEKTAASDSEKQAVIDASKKFFESETYTNGIALYEETFGEKPALPQFVAAYTLKCDDVEGFAVDYVLCNVKAGIAWTASNGEVMSNDVILFIVDNKTGTVYDTISCDAQLAEFDFVLETEEDIALSFLCSGILHEGSSDGYFWGETETTTRFIASDLKEIQKTVIG
ncbi:MAG: hypothetical protein E7488_03780 [Ruminococcaceae bacterium]|nr:hypothetical protein [Oscillospiraceae bacterium]